MGFAGVNSRHRQGFLPPSSESATAGSVPISFLSLTSAFIATSPLTHTHVCLRRTLGITLNPPRESRGISPFSRSLLTSAKSLFPWKLTHSQLCRIRTAHLWGYSYSSSGHTWFLSSLLGYHRSALFQMLYTHLLIESAQPSHAVGTIITTISFHGCGKYHKSEHTVPIMGSLLQTAFCEGPVSTPFHHLFRAEVITAPFLSSGRYCFCH